METDLASHPEVQTLIDLALAEDLGPGDLTVRALIEPGLRMTARLVAREAGVLAGLVLAPEILRRVGAGVAVEPVINDGQALAPGQVIARLRGEAATILIAERSLLNFMQRLSGIATLTARYVAAVKGTGARIYDTRKTVPGLRRLSKYAVRLGGGENHRLGLFDQVLVKDTHLAALCWRPAAEPGGGVRSLGLILSGAKAPPAVKPSALPCPRAPRSAAGHRTASGKASADAAALFIDVLRRCRAHAPRAMVEVEVRDLIEAEAALCAGADIVMLDNFDLAGLRAAVALRVRLGLARIPLEASGGITLANVRAVAEMGVERISVGALTHSAPALDLALEGHVPKRPSVA